MRGLAKAFIIGNLTRDPETRATPSGAQVTSFSIAVNRTYKGADGGQKEQVSFIECVAWGKTGEIIAQYCQKGSPLLVTGRIEQRSWEDKTTGQKRSRVEVVVEDFNFVSGSGASQGGGSSKKATDDFAPEDLPADEAINLDDIPF